MKMLVNAKRIKQLRDQKCWSQLQLSEMAGISLRTLQRVEAKSVASQETIKSIAAVLEVDCDTLLNDQPVPIQAEQIESTELPEGTSTEVLSINDDELTQSKNVLRRRLIISALVVAIAAAFGFWGVFSAFAENRIDQEQFSLLKNLVSIGLLLGLAGVGYRAFKAGLISRSDLY